MKKIDFDADMKKLCVLIAVVIALEIPLFFMWRNFSKKAEEVPEQTISLSQETTQPEETAQTEVTAATEPTAAETTVPAVTVPETTAAVETVPETTAAEETVAEITAAEETVAETTVPEETVPESTVLEETVPETTVPQETVPEATEPAAAGPARPEVLSFDQVPQFYQDDYPDEPYSYSTVARSGGSMTALAMVATYMTEHPYYPDQMADWLAHFLGGDYPRFEYGCDLLQLSWKRGVNVHETLNAVKDGKVAVILFSSKSLFGAERYVILTGVNSDGTFQAMDTRSPESGGAWLKSYFEKGFTQGQMTGGYSAGWIFDKDAMPEEPFVYEPEPPAEECRYGDLELTQEERNLLVKLICMEAGSESFEGQQAVAEVVLNRLHSGKFQSNIRNIIYAPGQFPSTDNFHLAKPTYSQYKAVDQALNGPYVLSEDVYFFGKFQINKNVWGKIGSHYFCRAY